MLLILMLKLLICLRSEWFRKINDRHTFNKWKNNLLVKEEVNWEMVSISLLLIRVVVKEKGMNMESNLLDYNNLEASKDQRNFV